MNRPSLSIDYAKRRITVRSQRGVRDLKKEYLYTRDLLKDRNKHLDEVYGQVYELKSRVKRDKLVFAVAAVCIAVTIVVLVW